MENVKSEYRTFYRALERFENEFIFKVNPTCPLAMWKITRLHLILQPDDDDFDPAKAERLIYKIRIVLAVTRTALDGVGPYLKAGEQWWLRAKSNSLGVFASIVELSLIDLQLENMDVPPPSSSGVGSLNLAEIDSRRLIDEELYQDIAQLVNVLS